VCSSVSVCASFPDRSASCALRQDKKLANDAKKDTRQVANDAKKYTTRRTKPVVAFLTILQRDHELRCEAQLAHWRKTDVARYGRQLLALVHRHRSVGLIRVSLVLIIIVSSQQVLNGWHLFKFFGLLLRRPPLSEMPSKP